MLKIHLGYLLTDEKIIFIVKYSNMINSLRDKEIYDSPDPKTLTLGSSSHPEYDHINNILYLPGINKNRDNDIIFFQMGNQNIDIEYRGLFHEINIIVNKIIYTVNIYNDKLSNIQLSSDRYIILEHIPLMEILKIEKDIIYHLITKEGVSNHSLYYKTNTNIFEYYNDINRIS